MGKKINTAGTILMSLENDKPILKCAIEKSFLDEAITMVFEKKKTMYAIFEIKEDTNENNGV